MDALSRSLIIALGGAFGANARYWLGAWVQSKAGQTFPWGTFLVNLSGSFLIGLFMGLFLGSGWNPNWRFFIVVGVLGGFTTYSAFAYETVELARSGGYVQAGLNVLATTVGALVAAWLGLALTRVLVK